MKMRNYGFTLIELMVVTSIISMLSSTTLVALGKARNKAVDSKVVQTFTGIKTQAEMSRSDYTNFCNNNSIVNLGESINGECYISGAAWAIYAPLKDPKPGKNGLCVDSTGLQQQVNKTSFMCNPTNCMAGGGCMP